MEQRTPLPARAERRKGLYTTTPTGDRAACSLAHRTSRSQTHGGDSGAHGRGPVVSMGGRLLSRSAGRYAGVGEALRAQRQTVTPPVWSGSPDILKGHI